MIILSLFYHNSEQFIGPASPFLGCKKNSSLFFPNTNCMNKIKQFFGIDISKDVFDVVILRILIISTKMIPQGLRSSTKS